MTKTITQRSGAHFDLGDNKPDQILRSIESGRLGWVNKKHLAILGQLAKLAQDTGQTSWTQAELARILEVTPRTLTTHAEAMTAEHIFRQTKLNDVTGVGRKPSLFRLNPLRALETCSFEEPLNQSSRSDKSPQSVSEDSIDKEVLRSGAQYDIGTNEWQDVLEVIEAGELDWVHKKHLDIVRHLASLCKHTGQTRVNQQSLADASGVTASTLAVYCEALVRKHVFAKQKLRLKGKGRKPNLYTLNDISLLKKNEFGEIIRNADNLSRTEFGAPEDNNQLALFDAQQFPAPVDRQILVIPGDPYKADILSTYTLLSALRLGKSGDRTEGAYVSDIYIGPDRLRVKVSAPQGYRIAGIIDTKALIALSTKARSYFPLIDDHIALPTNPLVMSMSELLQLLRFKSDGGYKQQAWKMVQSWRHTSFEVQAMTRRIRDLFGDSFMHHQEFSFISRIDALVETSTGIPEQFAIHFDPMFLARVLHKDSRFISTVHSEIMQESTASKLLLYYWCRRAIQLKSTPSEYYSTRHLKREMAPYMYDKQFDAVMDTVAEKTRREDGQHELFGYMFNRMEDTEAPRKTNRTQWKYQFWLSPSDPILLARNRHLAALYNTP